MFSKGSKNHRMRRTISWMFVLMLVLLSSSAFAQNMTVLKSNGLAAVIGAGNDAGLKDGDLLAVKRLINGTWREITYVQVTTVRSNISRVEVVEIAPQVNLAKGDRVEPMDSQGTPIQSNTAQPQNQPARRSKYPTTPMKTMYVGPMVGIIQPLGALSDDGMEYGILYGGAFGYRFRPEMDMTVRFFYSMKKDVWTMWNFQMLGRRFFSMGLYLEVGYDILYPGWDSEYTPNNVTQDARISLGFVGGLGYQFRIAPVLSAELGFTYHIYPNFAGTTGQFLTIQGRLIL